MAGLQLALVDQHPVGGEVGEAVGGGVGPGEVLGAGEELLRLHLGELGEGAPGGLVAPDPLARRGQRVEPVHLDVLVGGLVAVDDDLVAGLPAGDSLADLPDDPRRVGAADVVAVLGVVAVAEDRDRLAQRRPDVVEVDAGRHHADDHLEGPWLGNLDLLELEGVVWLALALLADHPGRHRLGQGSGLDVQLRDCACVNGQLGPPRVFGNGRRILTARWLRLRRSRRGPTARPTPRPAGRWPQARVARRRRSAAQNVRPAPAPRGPCPRQHRAPRCGAAWAGDCARPRRSLCCRRRRRVKLCADLAEVLEEDSRAVVQVTTGLGDLLRLSSHFLSPPAELYRPQKSRPAWSGSR